MRELNYISFYLKHGVSIDIPKEFIGYFRIKVKGSFFRVNKKDFIDALEAEEVFIQISPKTNCMDFYN